MFSIIYSSCNRSSDWKFHCIGWLVVRDARSVATRAAACRPPRRCRHRFERTRWRSKSFGATHNKTRRARVCAQRFSHYIARRAGRFQVYGFKWTDANCEWYFDVLLPSKCANSSIYRCSSRWDSSCSGGAGHSHWTRARASVQRRAGAREVASQVDKAGAHILFREVFQKNNNLVARARLLVKPDVYEKLLCTNGKRWCAGPSCLLLVEARVRSLSNPLLRAGGSAFVDSLEQISGCAKLNLLNYTNW